MNIVVAVRCCIRHCFLGAFLGAALERPVARTRDHQPSNQRYSTACCRGAMQAGLRLRVVNSILTRTDTRQVVYCCRALSMLTLRNESSIPRISLMPQAHLLLLL